MVRLPGNKKQTYRLNSRPQIWPWGLTLAMTLTLNFQGQIWNLLYLGQEWSDCHETKSKHIDWIQGLKCDHGIWPWPWPWPWIFKVKYGICYISIKSDLTVRCKDLQDSDRGDFWCRRAVDSSSYVLDNSCKTNSKADLACHIDIRLRSIFPIKLNGDFHEHINDCKE